MRFEKELKVLVVDDTVAMRTIVRQALQKIGIKNIEEACDGELALLTLQEAMLGPDKFDIVVSDWYMPNMTGIELLEKVRASSVLKELPFMMVTAEGEMKQVAEAAKAGVNGIIIKPFSVEKFEKEFQRVCELCGLVKPLS